VLRHSVFIAAFVAALLSPVAATTTPHVIIVAPTGKDSNDGSLENPFSSPEHAMNVAKAGDTVYLRAGSYVISNRLMIEKPRLTVATYPPDLPERAVLVGAKTADPIIFDYRADDVSISDLRVVALSADTKTNNVVVVYEGNRVSLVNLDVQGGKSYGMKIDAYDGDPHKRPTSTTGVIIRNCHVHDTGAKGIKTFNADHLLIEDSEIAHTGVQDPSSGEGIDSIGSKGITIRRSYIHDTSTNGVYLKGGTVHGIVEDSRVQNTGLFAGILLGQDTSLQWMRDKVKYEAIDCVARNNVVINTGVAGLGTYSASNIRFENNTLFDVAKDGQAALWVVRNRQSINPQHIVFKNNIVVMQSTQPFVFVQHLTGRLISDSNIFYNPRGQYEFRREAGPQNRRVSWDIGAWKRNMKVDRRSRLVDPKIDVENLCRLRPGSPAIGRGEILPDVPFDYSHVRRGRHGGFDIGAHEYRASEATARRTAQNQRVPSSRVP
jgi:hypothetical protein